MAVHAAIALPYVRQGQLPGQGEEGISPDLAQYPEPKARLK
jgi:hypothetical protein